MNEELRKTGIGIIGDVPWGTHFCQFYRTAQDLLDVLVPYFTEGLRNNEFCMWITSEPLRAEAARQAMEKAVPGFADYVRKGQIEILPYTDWYVKGGRFDSDRVLADWVAKLERALAAGFEGLRLTRNTFWLEAKDWAAFTDYEEAVDGVIGRYRMLAVCTYSLDKCGANEVLDVIRNHRFALIRREGAWELIESADRKRAQEELKRATQFPEQNPNPVLRVGLGGDLLYANAPARTMLEAMGRTEEQPVPAPLLALVAETGAGGGVVEIELADDRGQTFWFAAKRPEGEPYVNLYARDVTPRKKAEEALAAAHLQLQSVIDGTPSMIYACDLDARFVFVNAALAALLKTTPEQMLGKRRHEFMPREDADAHEANDRDVIATGRAIEIEEHSDLQGRSITWLSTKFPLCDAQGRVYAVAGIVTDITARKQAEALRQALAEQEKLRLGAAVEQSSDAVLMLDLDGTIRYVNAAFEAINDQSRAEALGRSYFDLLGDEKASSAIRAAITEGGPWRGALSRLGRDGRPMQLELTLSQALDPSGAVIGYLITEKDVTREAALQRQVRQAQKTEALGTLAGGIAHDFNNILGTIVINTELALLDLAPTDPARQPLPLVLQAANRGKELVKQIITFSRQREWDLKPIEVASIVKEGMKLLHSALPKDVAIHETIDPGCGVVLGDPSHIHQILVNLCQNAALAMREKGGVLEVKLEQIQVDEAVAGRHPDLRPGPYVRLTVADSGCGMSREIMDRIFEPFFTTREPGQGSGLGLAVVHGLVYGYRGAITVYSEPGKGSTIGVYLPRHKGPASPTEADKAPQPHRGSARILLVEDEPAQRESLIQGLKRLGYRVTGRASGRSALAAFRKTPAAFDLIVTDQTMPAMTGLELAEAVTRIRPGFPVILCTGFSEKVNGGSIEEHGIRRLLMKPFTIQELTQVISESVPPNKGGKTPD